MRRGIGVRLALLVCALAAVTACSAPQVRPAQYLGRWEPAAAPGAVAVPGPVEIANQPRWQASFTMVPGQTPVAAGAEFSRNTLQVTIPEVGPGTLVYIPEWDQLQLTTTITISGRPFTIAQLFSRARGEV